MDGLQVQIIIPKRSWGVVPGGWEKKEGEIEKPNGRRCDLKHCVEREPGPFLA